MKKLLLFAAGLFTTFSLFSQEDCSDLFISEYIEGWSNNKALEIYNPTLSTIDMTDTYRLIRWSNGSETADQDFRYVLPLEGTISAKDVIVIIQDTLYPGQDTMIDPLLRSKATYLAPPDYESNTQGCRVVFWNGDDAISLQKLVGEAWVDIDILGEIGVRPLNWQGGTSPAGGWDDTPPYADGQGSYLTKDQGLVRKFSVTRGISREEMDQYGPNSFYALAEYDSIPNLVFDSVGFHNCECNSLSVEENRNEWQAHLYPNPLRNGVLNIRAEERMAQLELLTIFGQQVVREKISGNTYRLSLPGNLPEGFYIVRLLSEDGRYSSVKVMVY